MEGGRAAQGNFPKVVSSLLDEPGIELLSWAVLTLSSNCQPRQVSAEDESGRETQLLRWEPAEPKGRPVTPRRGGRVDVWLVLRAQPCC